MFIELEKYSNELFLSRIAVLDTSKNDQETKFTIIYYVISRAGIKKHLNNFFIYIFIN